MILWVFSNLNDSIVSMKKKKRKKKRDFGIMVVMGFPAHGRGLELGLYGPFQLKLFYDAVTSLDMHIFLCKI